MIQFCGIDIIEVNRIKDAILNTPGFRKKVFTKREIEVGERKSDVVKYQYYAGRFAAKEAVYKALSNRYAKELWLGDIEILNDEKLSGRPYVILNSEELKLLQNQGKIIIDVSISHIQELAVANSTVCIY